jgi:3-oxoisoapionate decarboxylase
MRAGISSFAFGWAVQEGVFDEQGLLAFARQHGVGVVQIADNLAAHAMPSARLAAFIDAAEAAGIEIELGARMLTRAHLDTYLDLCGRCRSRLLRFVVDAAGYEPSADAVIALVKEAAPAIESAGVTLAIENHDRFPVATLRHIVESIGSPAVGVCLDTANSLGAGEGLSEVLGELAAITVNLHVKDVAIARFPHLMGFTVEGRALGRGQLALREAIARVDAGTRGQCRTVVLEGWTPPVSPVVTTETALEAAIEAARRATIETELDWAAEGITTLAAWLAEATRQRPIA